MSAEQIISDWKKNIYKPFYWLEGEENYYIDKIMDYAEHHILSEAEAGFNLTVFYGRDAEWTEVLNACKRFPMFAERQVVLLKEAQYMKDIAKLETYFEQPQPSTVLVVGYKEKKLDARTKLAKTVKQKGELFSTKKIYDSKLPEWTQQMVQQHGYTINQKAVLLLVDHIGNDLSRIENEVNKILVNLRDRKNITEEDIETYVGISKEFNAFELQLAIAQKNLSKAVRIVQYFEQNPKAAPIQVILPTLYNFFSKTAMVFGVSGGESAVASAIGVNPYFVKDYVQAAKNYGAQGVENILLLLHKYNLRSIGINDAGTSDADLMKEMMVKMMY
ncbi:DNA polymerase III subunit delta [Arachidicoccus ginsenosidimutans]|uniref:DNA polymerase III subunit delta n=1 Tax=Arachidicoccus sp. BS20 TaxID=1850526 RepID=UPI0007F0EE66|nr:DNA polymerase III subunit delta [Arachidicoccus sp. BS20]ANI89167.1 DNA polymerase III subunit delta [Arachidicoccus sp. BS20]